MTLLYEKAVKNKQVIENKIGRTAVCIAHHLDQEGRDGKNRVEVILKHRFPGRSIGQTVSELGAAVVDLSATEGWMFDLEASAAIGKTELPFNGYGNSAPHARLWSKPALVFLRQAMAEVIPLPAAAPQHQPSYDQLAA